MHLEQTAQMEPFLVVGRRPLCWRQPPKASLHFVVDLIRSDFASELSTTGTRNILLAEGLNAATGTDGKHYIPQAESAHRRALNTSVLTAFYGQFTDFT